VLQAAAPAPEAEEEKPLKEVNVEVKAAPSPPPAVEEVKQISPVLFTPAPEMENKIEELIAAPQKEDTLVVEEALPVVDVPTPELEVIPIITATADPPVPAPEPELVKFVVAKPAPPAPSPPPPPPSLSQPPQQEPPQQQQRQKEGTTNTTSSSSSSGTSTTSSAGLPSKDVLTLPRVGKVGLALPFDYQPFPKDAFANIACGFASVSTHFKTHFAGIASTSTENENACGSCMAVRCADPAKCPYGTEIVVQVVDTCGSCGVNDVNISPDALNAVMLGTSSNNTTTNTTNTTTTNSSVTSVSDLRVTWRKVPCRDQTQGTMYLHIITNGNEYYMQMSLSNAAQEIQAVSINGQSLSRMTGIGGGRWEWANNGNKLNLSLPAVLKVTGMDGKVVNVDLQKFESQELPSGGQI
jgi:hypothetical protein